MRFSNGAGSAVCSAKVHAGQGAGQVSGTKATNRNETLMTLVAANKRLKSNQAKPSHQVSDIPKIW
jgi:hypothetical protein